MCYSFCGLSASTLVCTHSQTGPFKICVGYHRFPAQSLSTVPIPIFLWLGRRLRPIWPLRIVISLVSFPTIPALISSATQPCCYPLSVPSTLLPQGLCIGFSSAWNPFSHILLGFTLMSPIRGAFLDHSISDPQRGIFLRPHSYHPAPSPPDYLCHHY